MVVEGEGRTVQSERPTVVAEGGGGAVGGVSGDVRAEEGKLMGRSGRSRGGRGLISLDMNVDLDCCC